MGARWRVVLARVVERHVGMGHAVAILASFRGLYFGAGHAILAHDERSILNRRPPAFGYAE
jgi:hypothetical protein